MKKTISVILATIMMFMLCVPMTAFAANTTWATTQTYTTSTTIHTGDTVTITGTCTVQDNAVLTVQEGAVLIIANGGTLVISGNGSLVNNGTVTVDNGGTLSLTAVGSSANSAALVNNGKFTVKSAAVCILSKNAYAFNTGVIENAEKIITEGTLNHKVQMPFIGAVNYKKTETWNRTDMTVNFEVKHFYYNMDKEEGGDTDLAYRDENRYHMQDADWVEQGNTLFITIVPEDGIGCWVDSARMQLVANGTRINAIDRTDSGNAVFRIEPTNALSLSVYSTAYKDIVKIYTVELPNNDAYYVITNNNEVGKTTVEYGKVLSFRVVLNPEYDKSEGNYVVYVNSYAMVQKDVIQDGGMASDTNDFGYYDVSTNPKGEITTEGGMQSDITIQVMGVVPNDRIDLMTNIASFVKEIFDVIKSIFSYFKDIFSGLGSIGGNVA